MIANNFIKSAKFYIYSKDRIAELDKTIEKIKSNNDFGDFDTYFLRLEKDVLIKNIMYVDEVIGKIEVSNKELIPLMIDVYINKYEPYSNLKTNLDIANKYSITRRTLQSKLAMLSKEIELSQITNAISVSCNNTSAVWENSSIESYQDTQYNLLKASFLKIRDSLKIYRQELENYEYCKAKALNIKSINFAIPYNKSHKPKNYNEALFKSIENLESNIKKHKQILLLIQEITNLLPFHLRSIFIMHYFEKINYKSIVERLNFGTDKNLINEVNDALKEISKHQLATYMVDLVKLEYPESIQE